MDVEGVRVAVAAHGLHKGAVAVCLARRIDHGAVEYLFDGSMNRDREFGPGQSKLVAIGHGPEPIDAPERADHPATTDDN